jgi:hypothetical protein
MATMDSTKVKHWPHAKKQLDERKFMAAINVERSALRVLRRITIQLCVYLRHGCTSLFYVLVLVD